MQTETIVHPPVLDVCCGPRSMWFDKDDIRAIYMDRRKEVITADYPCGSYRYEVRPDIVADFTSIPFPDNTFALVVMDPPHIEQDPKTSSGLLVRQYGNLSGDWKQMLRLGFSECFRVLRPSGVFIFKWNECRIPVREILALTDRKPLFGHRSGKKSQTHWIAFIK